MNKRILGNFFGSLIKTLILILSLILVYSLKENSVVSIICGFIILGLLFIKAYFESATPKINNASVDFEEGILSNDNMSVPKENPYRNMFEEGSQKDAISEIMDLVLSKGIKHPSISPDPNGRLALGFNDEDGQFNVICKLALPDANLSKDDPQWEILMSKIKEDILKSIGDN